MFFLPVLRRILQVLGCRWNSNCSRWWRTNSPVYSSSTGNCLSQMSLNFVCCISSSSSFTDSTCAWVVSSTCFGCCVWESFILCHEQGISPTPQVRIFKVEVLRLSDWWGFFYDCQVLWFVVGKIHMSLGDFRLTLTINPIMPPKLVPPSEIQKHCCLF